MYIHWRWRRNRNFLRRTGIETELGHIPLIGAAGVIGSTVAAGALLALVG
jgi:hypothetical protein